MGTDNANWGTALTDSLKGIFTQQYDTVTADSGTAGAPAPGTAIPVNNIGGATLGHAYTSALGQAAAQTRNQHAAQAFAQTPMPYPPSDAQEDKPTLEATGDPVQDAVNEAVRDLT